MKSLVLALFAKYYYAAKIKEDVVGGRGGGIRKQSIVRAFLKKTLTLIPGSITHTVPFKRVYKYRTKVCTRVSCS